MEGLEYSDLDFGAYLAGMFFASACIAGAMGVFTVIKSIKAVGPPLIIVVAMVVYLWWSGELANYI